MSNADCNRIGDVRGQLLAKNLPGLALLNIGNIHFNLGDNNLSDLAVRSISQMHQLTELYIGTYTCTNSGYNNIGDEAAELIATLPLLVTLDISTYVDNLDRTKITRRGLLALCRLKLTFLGIGKVISYLGQNNYSDEETLVVARLVASIQKLSVQYNKLGWEGVASIANSLTRLETLWMYSTEDVGKGVTQLGRLSLLKVLSAGTLRAYTGNTGMKKWTLFALVKHLRRLTSL